MKQLILALLLSSIGLLAQSADPLAGAWEHLGGKNFTTNTERVAANPPLRLIYANGHYIQFVAPANRQRIPKPLPQMTKEELTTRVKGVEGQPGTYRLEETRHIRNDVSAHDPRNEGREDTFEFRIECDTLVIKGKTQIGEEFENRYRRLK